MKRKLTLEQAKARFPHRYTMEHCPRWAREARVPEQWYAPQYRTDAEWYENTAFPGEFQHPCGKQHNGYAYSYNQSWPLGQWLTAPFTELQKAS